MSGGWGCDMSCRTCGTRGHVFFARDGKGFGFGAPAAGCSRDFHDPWRVVAWYGGSPSSQVNHASAQQAWPTVLSARAPYSCSPDPCESIHAEYIAPHGAALDTRRARLHLRVGSSRPPPHRDPCCASAQAHTTWHCHTDVGSAPCFAPRRHIQAVPEGDSRPRCLEWA